GSAQLYLIFIRCPSAKRKKTQESGTSFDPVFGNKRRFAMGSKRGSGAGGSARGKATDLTRKQDSQHKIESTRDDATQPVKSGRNMGGRGLDGERTRPTEKKKNFSNTK